MSFDRKCLIKDSSQVDRVAYSHDLKEMRVWFKDGSTYTYSDVPEWVFGGLVSNVSPGKYLASEVKGYYQYRKEM